MNYINYFIADKKETKPLSDEEIKRLFRGDTRVDGYTGSISIRDFLINHNLHLVISILNRKYNDCDKAELFPVGVIGLIKAVDTFDVKKGYKFSTYASKCIINEINMTLRKNKILRITDSIEDILGEGKNGSELTLKDTLFDEQDFVEDNINAELYKVIREIVGNLPERERKIITYYYGFNKGKRINQRHIAEEFNITQSQISRIIKTVTIEIGIKLHEMGLISLPVNYLNKNTRIHSIKSIYTFFEGHSKEEIDSVILSLSDEEKALIYLRNGNDLENPKPTKLNRMQTIKYYNLIIPKIKRKLNKLGLEKIGLFEKLISSLGIKDSFIIALRFGYINGTEYSTNEIANFLGIEETEVIDVSRNFLLYYKNNMSKLSNTSDNVELEM